MEIIEMSSDIASDDDSIPLDSGIRRVFDLWRSITKGAGFKVLGNDNGMELVRDLEMAGFVDVKVRLPKYGPHYSWVTDMNIAITGLRDQAAMDSVAGESSLEERFVPSTLAVVTLS